MSFTLIVAEKPSVARDIARVLGVKERGEGFLRGEKYIVTWAIGHLVSLKEPEELDEQYKRWRASDLPILPKDMTLKVLPNTKSQFATIKTLMHRDDVHSLICATDSGREGELIFRYIYHMAECQKPFERLWISSMTDESIKKGFASLKPSSQYDALYHSARCRSEADWLIGMNATRAFTLRYGVLLSIGRVQTPTLQMLVKRRLEIDRFVPSAYFTVQATFEDYKATWVDPQNDYGKKIEKKEQADQIVLSTKGKMARVSSLKNEQKSEAAPQLYDLTTLQREASNQLGFTADKTLKIAQSLYEKYKLITYPRTDSRYLSQDIHPNLPRVLRALDKRYQRFIAPLLASPLPKNKRIFDDGKVTDHHAIIPTDKKADVSSLPADEGKLFDLIARKLIAAFYPPFLYSATRVLTECEGHLFLSTGTTVIQEGFKEIYRDMKTKKEKKEESAKTTLPALSEGDTRKASPVKAVEDKTKPPKEHNDATLLSSMEHAGRSIEDEALRNELKGCSLGTPATRAAIIERLITVGYAKRKGRQILATEKGVSLMQAVPSDIASPETTGKWEQALEQIAGGSGDDARFMEGIKRLTTHLTHYAKSAPNVSFPMEESKHKTKSASTLPTLGIPCPICQKGEMTENSKAFGCSLWREGCKFTIWKNSVSGMGGPELTEKLIKAVFASETQCIRGSTGLLYWQNGHISFAKNPPPQSKET